MKAKIGDHVIYVDSLSKRRPALVTSVHSGMNGLADGVNVVIVNDDEAQTDTYGRKIERFTSVPHQSGQPAAGYYWVAA